MAALGEYMRRLISIVALACIPVAACAANNLSSYFTFMGFTLESTELSEIQEAMGVAPIYQRGDAAESYSVICYRLPKDNITVYFESGEMGGGTILLSYRVANESSPDFTCANATNARIRDFNVGALVIGSKTNVVISSLPKGYIADGKLGFSYFTKIQFTKEQIAKYEVEDMQYAFWDQSVNIEIIADGNVLNGFRVSKVTSW